MVELGSYSELDSPLLQVSTAGSLDTDDLFDCLPYSCWKSKLRSTQLTELLRTGEVPISLSIALVVADARDGLFGFCMDLRLHPLPFAGLSALDELFVDPPRL